MKTPVLTPPSATDSAPPLIDTSRMNAGQKAALEMAEAARDATDNHGFAASIFDGRPRCEKLLPFPAQSLEDRDQGDAFLAKLRDLLVHRADPDAIDASGEIPEDLIAELARIGAFGIKIPIEYGGLGLSQTNYSRAAMLLGRHCGNLTALLSAHQSIGAPQPLLLFGTEAQKRRYLPRCARGEISAFALTEVDAGSDPARLHTHAEPTADGSGFLLNGEKLWCTNGTRAGLLVVMARTPLPEKPHATTAFIVETDWPGVEVAHRCRFMGLRALYNGVLRFHDVFVPKENILGGLGRGLKVALTTLNTGRITLPAACVGLSGRCLEISTRWAREREQWGHPIGQHAAIAEKLARMAAEHHALEATVRYISSLVDRDKHADVRLEAALAKMWGSEIAWRAVDDTLQIRGGRGFETAASLKARGETPDPVERLFRDARINTIFEGSSEIMRLFIAREVLDPHLKIGAAAVNTRLPAVQRLRAAARAGLHYLTWYPTRWLPVPLGASATPLPPDLKKDLRRIQRFSRRLSRAIFHSMARYGPALERRQLLLGTLVEIGAELFVWSCSLADAAQSLDDQPKRLRLARHFGLIARDRIAQRFAALRRGTHDMQALSLSRDLVAVE